MAKYDITSKVLFQDYERDFIACFCILSNLVYEMDLVQKLVKEVQTMIDFENIPLIKMYTEKARLEERERAQEELREAYTNVLLQIIDQEFGKRGVEELEPHIRAIEDGQKLASLIAPAVRSHSIDEFKRVLEQV